MSQGGSLVDAFDLHSPNGVMAVLASVRASKLSPTEKNELRDLVFLYTNGGGDASVRIALEQKLNTHQIVPVMARRANPNAPALAFGSYRPTPNFKAPTAQVSVPTEPVSVVPSAYTPIEPTVQATTVPVQPAQVITPIVQTAVTPQQPIAQVVQAPAAQPVPTSAPTVPAASPAETNFLERIRQIKTAVNSKVGNPVNLVDINNEVGREYMNALLEAMKKLGAGAVSEMGPAMQRLETAYSAVEVAITNHATSKEAVPEPVVVQTTPPVQVQPLQVPQPIIPPRVPPAPAAPTPTPPPVPAVPISQSIPVPQVVPEVREPVIATISTPVPLPVQPVPTPPPVPRPAPAPVSSPAPVPVSVKEVESAPLRVVPTPLPVRPATPVFAPVAPEAPREIPINNVPITNRQAIAPTAKEVSTESGFTNQPESAPIPVPTSPSIADTKQIMRPSDLPDAASLETSENGDPLFTKEVDDGLHQLLSDWVLFKKSGLFGTGPKGKEHPLFKKIAELQVPLLLAGRFDGASQEIRQSITDYMNGWRYEQGIIYQPGESFEKYLRRVIKHILDLQRKQKQA